MIISFHILPQGPSSATMQTSLVNTIFIYVIINIFTLLKCKKYIVLNPLVKPKEQYSIILQDA